MGALSVMGVYTLRYKSLCDVGMASLVSLLTLKLLVHMSVYIIGRRRTKKKNANLYRRTECMFVKNLWPRPKGQ